ncbi:MAG: hypothetical protein Q7O66_22685, partial [Dehalococcoidia bacterium]|nr:hypothetical protein [Dehalococcoidia bacterium]
MASRALALDLVPSFQFAEVLTRQHETREARRLLELKSGFSIEGARDVRSLVRQAALGGALEPPMLLDIQSTLASGRSIKGIFNRLGYQFLTLSDIIKPISELRSLEDEINRSISPRGEILDSASPILGRIRSEIRIAHDRLVSRLNEILGSPIGRLVMQEPIITVREGRYVLPIKAEMKGQLRGIVHDTSASGMTLFMEPLGTVELNNQWRETQIDERREIDRVLKRLTARVARFGQAIVTNVECLAELDLALAKAKLAESMQATEPEVLAIRAGDQPDSVATTAESETPAPAKASTSSARYEDAKAVESVGAAPPFPPPCPLGRPRGQATTEPTRPRQALGRPLIQLLNARHPLLTGTVVPTTIEVGAGFSILVITGPNTGGKTVALKTAGLLTIMALSGLQIPADEGSKVSIVDGIYADIGDEQSIEQSLSTFSSHMGNIIEILKVASRRSLVLLDELGAGTDPTEGSALARALLSHLLQKGICAIATTHFNEIKAFAYTTPDVANASVEFDVETLTPTYKLSIGLPGRSNALAIAARLGLPDEIISRARDILSPAQVHVENLLGAIQAERDEAEISRRAMDQRLAATTRIEEELHRKRAEIETERTEA